MFEEISQHILDIAENSVAAQANEISITVVVRPGTDTVSFSVEDNGCGMSEDYVERVTNPFVTTRTTRRVGMGIPFLKQAAEQCSGTFYIKSQKGVGTKTFASFKYHAIDRPPLGDIASTLMTLIMGYPEINWKYHHISDKGEFNLTIDEIIEVLEDRELLRKPEIGLWLRDTINENLHSITP